MTDNLKIPQARSEITIVEPPQTVTEAVCRFRAMLAEWLKRGMEPELGVKLLHDLDSLPSKQ